VALFFFSSPNSLGHIRLFIHFYFHYQYCYLFIFNFFKWGRVARILRGQRVVSQPPSRAQDAGELSHCFPVQIEFTGPALQSLAQIEQGILVRLKGVVELGFLYLPKPQTAALSHFAFGEHT
jgi:hypothetical protein